MNYYDLPNIDWDNLDLQLDKLKVKLSRFTKSRQKLIDRYPKLVKDTKDIKIELNNALLLASTKRRAIENLAKEIHAERKKWVEEFNFDEEDFHLNERANLLLKEFEVHNKDRKEVVITIPRSLKEKYDSRNYETKTTLNKIRALQSQVKATQREIDNIQLVFFISDFYVTDGSYETFDEYCQLDVYQISIRRRNLHHRNNFLLGKVGTSWYEIVDGKAKEEEGELIPIDNTLQEIVDREIDFRANEIGLYKGRS